MRPQPLSGAFRPCPSAGNRRGRPGERLLDRALHRHSLLSHEGRGEGGRDQRSSTRDIPCTAIPSGCATAEALGGGEIVLIIAAFLTTDAITTALRGYLERRGYRAFGWGLGVNRGATPRLLAGVRARLTELARLANGKVSVVDVSHGGLLPRDLAHDRATEIGKVVRLAAPCRLPTARAIVPLFRLTAPFYAARSMSPACRSRCRYPR